jgi:hypothetical protein
MKNEEDVGINEEDTTPNQLCRKKHRRLRQFMTYKLLAALGKEKLKV